MFDGSRSIRTFTIATDNGLEEFNESVEYNGWEDRNVWPRGFFLRLAGTRGPSTGATRDLSLADLY